MVAPSRYWATKTTGIVASKGSHTVRVQPRSHLIFLQSSEWTWYPLQQICPLV